MSFCQHCGRPTSYCNGAIARKCAGGGTTPRRYCSVCGAALVRTSERYQACPHGHGPLVTAAKVDAERVAREDREFQRRVKEAGW